MRAAPGSRNERLAKLRAESKARILARIAAGEKQTGNEKWHMDERMPYPEDYFGVRLPERRGGRYGV